MTLHLLKNVFVVLGMVSLAFWIFACVAVFLENASVGNEMMMVAAVMLAVFALAGIYLGWSKIRRYRSNIKTSVTQRSLEIAWSISMLFIGLIVTPSLGGKLQEQVFYGTLLFAIPSAALLLVLSPIKEGVS
ncbi:hypothetical protein [Litoreibacter roseus]|uniref:Uncharacterized protein n=1 Tax=Litoreibacter roseus TaxID=2601869 RepID=A0A6N6JJM3_9RHOB|nr:hypothetical protein [Litoreibacter roseus]GFE66334.1 hypothetical protein KIN_34080 [Litoreibacter roseus]